MLSMKTSVYAEDAGDYYGQDDYYLEKTGYWHGHDGLMKTLRLSGEVKPEVFTKLLQGYLPIGGEPPTAIVENAGDEDRRGGSDFTFSAPKSVSLLSFKDERIQTAFDTAVRYALDYLQSEIQVRHKDNGDVSIETTGKAAFAVFNHATTRPPEEYGAPDPQLHAHCVMANITVDAERQTRSIHNPFTPEKNSFRRSIF